jgi:hypothetical protein
MASWASLITDSRSASVSFAVPSITSDIGALNKELLKRHDELGTVRQHLPQAVWMRQRVAGAQNKRVADYEPAHGRNTP